MAKLLRDKWPGRVAVRLSGQLEDQVLRSYLITRARRDGTVVLTLGPDYVIPGSWVVDLVALFVREPVEGRELIVRHLNGEPTKRARQYKAVTHCKRGHPYDAINTYVRPDGRGRQCLACERELKRANRAQKRKERS